MKEQIHFFLGDFGKQARCALKNFFAPLQNQIHQLYRRYQKARLDFQDQIHLPGTTKQQIHIVQGLTKKPFHQIHMGLPHRETFLHINEDEVTKEIVTCRNPVCTHPAVSNETEKMEKNPEIKHSQLRFF